ncbi:SDR family NAD(P)-dependent oxidoreductase [Nocardia pseudovaccinii]|uniref:SDR family NAD(P)-dependent oxidoreductase n=1 Tax=Nocardia pseudovaccinii TaxID=189540 RepID=UPI0007A544A9|nr:SDR family NAD(P)-dependent oxidoreductase [Nocardia pseudovaccinii]
MKSWFVTGAGRGFGREFVSAALERGDRVAATARASHSLQALVDSFGDRILPLELDVRDRQAVFAAVGTAVERFGGLDVIVNNAGYGLFGTVEEITEEQLRDQLEVNLFGAFHVTQAVLPQLRKQGGGHIVQISTVGGIASFPNLGGYHASKWALEGLSEALAQEVASFGIKVTLVEPGPYATDWAGSSAVHADRDPNYEFLRSATEKRQSATPSGFIGNPKGVGPALLEVVDAPEPPLRVLFGSMPTQLVPDLYEQRLRSWKEWEAVSMRANGH